MTIIKKYNVIMVYAEGWAINLIDNTKEYLSLPFNEIEYGKKIFLSRGTLKTQDFTLCNVIFNKNITIKLNSFSNPYNLCCDSELFLKSCLLGMVAVVKKPVSVYRYHKNNLILNYAKNINFIFNNNEYYINSYEFALNNKIFTKKELYEWKKRMYFKGIRLSIKLILKNRKYYAILIDIFKVFKKHRLMIEDYFLFLLDTIKHLFLKIKQLIKV